MCGMNASLHRSHCDAIQKGQKVTQNTKTVILAFTVALQCTAALKMVSVVLIFVFGRYILL